MNPHQLLEELLRRQIPFTLRDGFVFVAQGVAEDLRDALEAHCQEIARLLAEGFREPTQRAVQNRRTSARYRTMLPLPSGSRKPVRN
jgi:hypothetical protein